MYPTHEQERRFLRSKIPQTNYLTATDTADETNFKEMLVTDKNLTNHEVKAEDNKEESTGHFQPTDEYKTVHDTSVQKELKVCAEEVGRDLLLALGNITTTTPDAVGAPAVRKHAFKMQDLAVSKQAPAMTLIEIVGSVINRLIPSNVVEDYSLKGEGVARIMQTMGLRGSGLIVDPSGLTAADITALANLHYFTHSMVKLVFADSVALTNAEDFSADGNYLANWALSLKKNLLADEGYIPGAARYFVDGDEESGAIRSACLIESYEFGMNFNARLLAGSPALAALRSKKKLDVVIDIIGGQIDATAFNYKLSIHAPRVSYDTVELPSANGMYRVDIKPKIFFDTASDKDVEISLINKTASYTA
jgi:hypothetical protein